MRQLKQKIISFYPYMHLWTGYIPNAEGTSNWILFAEDYDINAILPSCNGVINNVPS